MDIAQLISFLSRHPSTRKDYAFVVTCIPEYNNILRSMALSLMEGSQMPFSMCFTASRGRSICIPPSILILWDFPHSLPW